MVKPINKYTKGFILQFNVEENQSCCSVNKNRVQPEQWFRMFLIAADCFLDRKSVCSPNFKKLLFKGTTPYQGRIFFIISCQNITQNFKKIVKKQEFFIKSQNCITPYGKKGNLSIT